MSTIPDYCPTCLRWMSQHIDGRCPDGELWPCLTCGQRIRVNPHACLGEPRYVHVMPAAHLALRGPNNKTEDRPSD